MEQTENYSLVSMDYTFSLAYFYNLIDISRMFIYLNKNNLKIKRLWQVK